MADLFAQASQQGGKKPPQLHSDTEIYVAVCSLGAFLYHRIPHIQSGMKTLLGETLLYEAGEMADLVRLTNIAHGADKLPLLDQMLSRLEKVKFHLRNSNEAGILPHSAYAESMGITDSIGKQAYGLKKRFYVPATTPVT